MKRVGVFICHCGVNIADTVDVKTVASRIGKVEGVIHSVDYIYMCSEPGQALIRKAIRSKGLDGVVVACCTPSMHENTFRKAVRAEGLNPYLCEIANIREQCSWVHQKNRDEATRKAEEIILATLEKLRQNEPLQSIALPATRRILVIGGGIAGISASLDLADGGYDVVLVEREPALGGHMAQLSITFPNGDPALSALVCRTSLLERHPRITIYCYSEVEDIEGYVGNFEAVIRKKPSYVDERKCTGCGACIVVCPVEKPFRFDGRIGKRKAIYKPFHGSGTVRPVIDGDSCLYFLNGTCNSCQKACPESAIDFEQREQRIEQRFGAIVVATGYDIYPLEMLGEYGYGRIKDVVDAMTFERMLAPDGPTGGKIIRPSDGKTPLEVVFVQCVASRDPDRYMPYCSRICCMYTAKQARLYAERVPDGQAYVFYMDVRSDSKAYEEYVQRAVQESGILYLRGRVSRIFAENGKVCVLGVDTLSGKAVEIKADLAVLAAAIVPAAGIKDLAAKLRTTVDRFGFFTEAHIKLYPVESATRGVYLAGCCQGPKDITDTVSQALAAAGKVQSLLSSGMIVQDPLIAYVEEDLCSGCGICVRICPYEAREIDHRRGISVVHEALCQGCGACIAACPNNACELRNSKAKQVLKMVETFVGS